MLLGLLALVPLLATALGPDPLEVGALVPCSTDQPQLVIGVLDVSSSVIDSKGADPKGRSFEEFVHVAELLRDTPCHSDDRVGAVIFANLSVEVPPIPTTSHSVIEATVRRPPTREIGEGTLIVPPLVRVRDMIARHPEHEPIVVVLSDMQSSEDQLAAALADVDAPLHLIALGEHDRSFDASFDSVVPLGGTERGDVGRILVSLINTARQP